MCAGFSDAWREILHETPTADSEFLREGGDSIKAIQITGILHRNNIRALTAADFLRTPKYTKLCEVLQADESNEQGTVDDGVQEQYVEYVPVASGQTIPLLPLQDALIRNHPEHWKEFYMLLPMVLASDVSERTIESWLKTLPERYEALRLAFSADGAKLLPQKVILQRCIFNVATDEVDLFNWALAAITRHLDPEKGRTFGAALAERKERDI